MCDADQTEERRRKEPERLFERFRFDYCSLSSRDRGLDPCQVSGHEMPTIKSGPRMTRDPKEKGVNPPSACFL